MNKEWIHDLLVKLLKLDIPTNYEEKMADLNARNDLESSHILHLRGNCYSIVLSKMYYLIFHIMQDYKE
jgi:hypothetical protein